MHVMDFSPQEPGSLLQGLVGLFIGLILALLLGQRASLN
jgi:hypothetical protein